MPRMEPGIPDGKKWRHWAARQPTALAEVNAHAVAEFGRIGVRVIDAWKYSGWADPAHPSAEERGKNLFTRDSMHLLPFALNGVLRETLSDVLDHLPPRITKWADNPAPSNTSVAG